MASSKINPLFQSPYIYLQAAGSDGSDGSAAGIHLRWSFFRKLGNEHLPKGDLSGSSGTYPSSSGFNRDNDFVNIYRVPYNRAFSVTLDLSVAPSQLTETADEKIWHYNGFIPVPNEPDNTTDLQVRFRDITVYNTIRATIDPMVQPLEFLGYYTEVIELSAVDKLLFKGVFELGVKNSANENTAQFNVETISLNHHSFDAPTVAERYSISCRKSIKRLDSVSQRTFMCENIAGFRFKGSNFYLKKITLSTYQDHILGEYQDRTGTFELVGKFSLDDGISDNDALVFKRLEDTSKYIINKRWPKFNQANSSTGEFTVKVQNYKDRWLDPKGLKPAVINYLDLSKTDPQATTYFPSEESDDSAAAEVSYLEMLRMVSTDFHAARMLGLGHIDLSKGTAPGIKDGGLTPAVVIGYINNLLNSSSKVRDYLVSKAPNSDEVLKAAINRLIPMNAEHLKAVLDATPLLSDDVLTTALNRFFPLPASSLESIMIANSPLSDDMLETLIEKSLLIQPDHLENILNTNGALSDKVLKTLINRILPLPVPYENLERIMVAQSPLSDDVLLALLNRTLPMLPENIREIFLQNTPISPLVEQVLRSKFWIPISIINEILNSTFIVSRINKTQYIYVMEYITDVAIEDVVPLQTTTHLYMSLPTSKIDYRLPPSPVLKPITYGLFLNNATANPTPLTDSNGYAPYSDERFINLKREQFYFERPFESFYASKDEFCICNQTFPIGYGIEYKLTSETNYRKPEINHDSEYKDLSGLPETVFVPEVGKGLVFNHQETEEGIHAYSLYSINWFSRVSPISNEQPTDYTKFPRRNTILPPLNFAVQLIQEESPLIFTTSAEQQQLAGITSSDKTLVRATFDWNHIHHKAYQFADYAELFFRQNPPLSVRGKIASVYPLPNNKAEIHTQFYMITSTNPAQTIQPYIAPSDVSRYIGSVFVAGEKSFIIEDIPTTGNNPVIVVGQLRETAVTDVDNTNIFTFSESFIAPEVGTLFLTLENLAEPSNWDSKLSKRIYLESFHTVFQLEINNSGVAANNKTYTLDSVTLSSGNTVLHIDEAIANASASPLGNITYPKRLKVISNNSTNKVFTVEGDISSELTTGASIRIRASVTIDGYYTVTAISVSGNNTHITVAEPFAQVDFPFYLQFNKSLVITNLDSVSKTVTVAGDVTSEIIPLHRETEHYPDGTEKRVLIGGITRTAIITEYEDKDGNGAIIPNSRTGVYEIIFDTYQLPEPINENAEWYKGVVRILEDASFLPTTLEPDRTIPKAKTLEVWQIDRTGSSLKLVAADTSLQVDENYNPINGYVPIQTGAGVSTNFHPSYRTYFLADTSGGNHFESSVILPDTGEGSRETYMAVRAIDTDENPALSSHIATPVLLLAQEITEPLPPGIPTGPTYATRPDFYGKATYTFDMHVNTSDGRKPYMLVFYRANERKILDQLYQPATVATILSDLEQLESPDKDFFTDRWNDLVNVHLDNNGLFKEYVPGGYRFPIPDNSSYTIPRMDVSIPAVHPFDGVTTPGMQLDIVKDAIDGAFFPLTEQPVLYSQVDTGKQTSGRKPRLRDNNGQLLTPFDSAFDPNPMVVKYTEAGETYIRFTDYGLDGASRNFYFYFGVEMSNQLKVSDRSPVAGPILLVNAFPAEDPTIQKTVTRLSNELLNVTTAVSFEINDYIISEGIQQIAIYRTSNPSDSLSVRTMKLVKTVAVGDEVIDDFSDVSFPLYGDPLFYRIVALRKIVNENDQTEYIPSKPSNVVLTNIVDNVNPPAPLLRSINGNTTSSELEDVILKWKPTCYNGIYSLEKMNESGNWDVIYTVKSNESILQYPPLDENNQPDFTNFPETALLHRYDEYGNQVYHRFRVEVENSSGLLNLDEYELTLAKGYTDLQELPSYLSFNDANNHELNILDNLDVVTGASEPDSMTFTHRNEPLPAGHNTFIKVEITVSDDLGNSMMKTINTEGGSITFNNGEGNLVLDDSQPNRVYTILTRLFTDFAVDGAVQKYSINYLAGPCYDLSLIKDLVSLTDSTHTINPLIDRAIDNGVAYPEFLTFKDISSLSVIGQVFVSMDITVSDDLGNTFTKTITSAEGEVTFLQNDGGLQLDATNPNRAYSISLILKTDLCSNGTERAYNVSYIFTPCNQLNGLTDIVSFTDGNSQVINPLVNSQLTSLNHPNGSITITEIVSLSLPSGHVFDSMQVILDDDLNGHISKTINSVNGSVTFTNGEGNLVLDNSDPDRTYYITLILYTNLCSNGSMYVYQVGYGLNT